MAFQAQRRPCRGLVSRTPSQWRGTEDRNGEGGGDHRKEGDSQERWMEEGEKGHTSSRWSYGSFHCGAGGETGTGRFPRWPQAPSGTGSDVGKGG